MSSLLNKARDKVEAVLDRNSNQGNDHRSDNYGPHSSNAANTINPTIDNNPQGRVGELGHAQTSHQYGSGQTAGTFTSSDNYGSSTNAPGYDDPRSGNTGPHSSNMMNKLDPRVDSDRDHRNDPTSRVGGAGNTQQPYDNYGNTGRVGGFGASESAYDNTSAAYNPTSVGAEPHRSNFANKLDPRHEAGHNARNDLGPATSGYSNVQTGPAATGVHGTTTTGYDNTFDNPRSTNAGPHSSNLMNKLDPRHDSDRDHRNDPTSRVGGYGDTQTDDYGHTTGIGSHDNTRIGEFDRPAGVGNTQPMSGTATEFGRQPGQPGSGYGESNFTPGSGTAQKTAGPHNSNILNKLDPRVDSDMDGSKTYGGNQTHY